MDLPPGFEERTLASGLSLPTAVDWAPDGRMFVAEKDGRVRVVTPAGNLREAPLLDISDHVNAVADRGLLGIAVDSDFESNRYLYLLYTYAKDNSVDSPGPTTSRLTRVVVKPNSTVENPEEPETVILGRRATPCPEPDNSIDCIPADHPNHTIGTVRSDVDGTLWIGSGDAAGWGAPDPLAFRAYDTATLAGKLIHIDRRGRGLPGHPFCPQDADLSHTCTKIHAKGFRNPYRFHLRPGRPPVVGDVGWNTREEIDLVKPGEDYGWPCYEGTVHTPGYEEWAECAAVYARDGTSAASEPPLFDYPRGPAGRAVVAGPMYQGDGYPSSFRRDLFFTDFGSGLTGRLTLDESDRLTATRPFGIGPGLAAVALEAAPNGNLVFVDIGVFSPGRVSEIVYSPGNRSPVARARAKPEWGRTPLEVKFLGSGSSDPDEDVLTYRWDFGDGSPRSSDPDPTHTYETPGNYVARLTVRDGRGRSASDTVSIAAGNTPPRTTIVTPTDGSRFKVGEEIELRGSATDEDDGRITGPGLKWRILLHHGGHVHPGAELSGRQTAFTTRTDHDADSYYEIRLTAEDSRGLEASRAVTIRPEAVPLTIRSQPPGAPVTYAGTGLRAPVELLSAIGFRTELSASQWFNRRSRTYVFDSWSDGTPRVHRFTVPAAPTTLTAAYEADNRAGPRLTFREPDGSAIDRLRGRARDPDGVETVAVGIRAEPEGTSCRWWSPRLRRLTERPRPCDEPLWITASLRPAEGDAFVWTAPLGAPLPPGAYALKFYGRDGSGQISRALTDGAETRRLDVKAP